MIMSEVTRELLLKVIDGHPDTPRIAYMVYQFRRRDEMLAWLVANRLTGSNLANWVQTNCGGSNFAAAKFVLTKVKRERELQPVIAETDFLARRLA